MLFRNLSRIREKYNTIASLVVAGFTPAYLSQKRRQNACDYLAAGAANGAFPRGAWEREGKNRCRNKFGMTRKEKTQASFQHRSRCFACPPSVWRVYPKSASGGFTATRGVRLNHA
jgi:hypothetical protein